MKKYEEPKLIITVIEGEDVIATSSTGPNLGENETEPGGGL